MLWFCFLGLPRYTVSTWEYALGRWCTFFGSQPNSATRNPDTGTTLGPAHFLAQLVSHFYPLETWVYPLYVVSPESWDCTLSNGMCHPLELPGFEIVDMSVTPRGSQAFGCVRFWKSYYKGVRFHSAGSGECLTGGCLGLSTTSQLMCESTVRSAGQGGGYQAHPAGLVG